MTKLQRVIAIAIAVLAIAVVESQIYLRGKINGYGEGYQDAQAFYLDRQGE